MRQAIRRWLAQLPVKWKMALWSSITLFVLFAAYNVAQYITVTQWMLNEEKQAIQRSMAELQNYYRDKQSGMNVSELLNSRSFLATMNERNQMIRILDAEGNPLITVSNHFHTDKLAPRSVSQTELTTMGHGDESWLVMRSPLEAGGFRGTIEIVNNIDPFERLTGMIVWVMIASGIFGLFLSALGSLMLVRQLLMPIHSLTETIQNVKRRGLHERVEHHGANDEFSRLTGLFNELLSELETAFKQQKQFVEDASHELRTPVSIVKGHLGLLLRWGKDDPQVLDKSLAVSLQEIERLEVIVRELIELNRAENDADPAPLMRLQPTESIEHAARLFRVLHPDFVFDTELSAIPAACTIRAAARQLEQILLILLDNAVKYSEDRKRVRLVGELRDGRLSISVVDQGIGIPADELPRVFDRFYRVDKARSREKGGSGLGLSIAKRLVQLNGGEIAIESDEGVGTRVRLMFPAGDPDEERRRV